MISRISNFHITISVESKDASKEKFSGVRCFLCHERINQLNGLFSATRQRAHNFLCFTDRENDFQHIDTSISLHCISELAAPIRLLSFFRSFPCQLLAFTRVHYICCMIITVF